MTRQIAQKFKRIQWHLERIRECVQKNDPVQAMTYCAEISTIADFLYNDFLNEAQKQFTAKPEK